MSNARDIARVGDIVGRKNAIINGNFDIWQRGSSFTAVNNAYSADRWRSLRGNGSADITREEFTLGQTDVPGEPKYFLRYDITTASTASIPYIEQRIERVRTLAGQQATISFWAKASKVVTLSGVFLIQNFGTGGSPSSDESVEAIGDISLTTEWQKITANVSLPSISGKTIGSDNNDFLKLFIETLNNDTFALDIAQVQLEKGSVATDFEQRPIGEELALCQRFAAPFELFSRNVTGADGETFGAPVYFPVTMRAAPSLTFDNNGQVENIREISPIETSGNGFGLQYKSDGGSSSVFVYGRTGFADAEL